MISRFNYFAPIHYNYLVGIFYGRQTMSHHDNCTSFVEIVEILNNFPLILSVKRISRLVQKYEIGILI